MLASILALALLPAADLPVVFDLRDVDGTSFVTSVKSQSGGTCWTHGAMASIEGNLLMNGEWAAAGETGEPDLAEYHLDWWNGFNEFFNGDVDPPTGTGLTVHMGGDYLVTSAYLSRGDGAVRDVDGQSYDTPPPFWLETFHAYYPMHIEWMTAGPGLERIDLIKQRLMEEGVVGTCMCYDGAWIQDYVHWQPPESEVPPNHAVAIVGWNDTLQTQAPQPGAWICKNSWGAGWGLDGFFYISYHDRWAGQEPFMGAVSFRDCVPLPWDEVYSHDYHGWRDDADGWAGHPEVTIGLNAFEATGSRMVEAAGIVTTSDSVNWAVRIYDSFDPALGPSGLRASEEGWTEFRGCHVVELGDPFEVDQGDSIFVLVEMDCPLAYDRTSDVPVLLGASYRTIVPSTASPGESWYWMYDCWHDFQDYGGNPFPGTGSLCIKLFASQTGLSVSGTGPYCLAGPVGGPWDPPGWTSVLVDQGPEPVEFRVEIDPAVEWLSLAGPSQGTLEPYEPLELSFAVNANAEDLPQGAYCASVAILNESGGEGGVTIPVALLVGEGEVIWSWDMDTDPGWDLSGDWEWGQPAGLGGEHGFPDPSAGHTGESVLGYDLGGDYGNLIPEYSAELGPIDCSMLYSVRLRYMRWLGVQEHGFDQAGLQVRTGRDDWQTVWQNPAWPAVTDSSWTFMEHDLSEIVDATDSVWIRWVMGPTNDGWRYCGWNLDDVQIVGLAYAGSGGVLPPSVIMDPVHPNPSSGQVTLDIHLPATAPAIVAVYDAAGRIVAVLYDGEMLQGSHSLVWDGSSADGEQAPVGVYHARVSSGGQSSSRSMVLLR